VDFTGADVLSAIETFELARLPGWMFGRGDELSVQVRVVERIVRAGER
jgi:hypothetical protein